jgi:hypothetical protein
MKIPRRPITAILIATLTVLCVPISAQNGVLNCASNDGRYHYCRADTQNRVRLVQQFSNSPCNQGYSWGFDYRGVWVDRGCRAQFEFGRRNNGGNTGAAVAAGVIGAIIVGAAVASSNNDSGDNRAATFPAAFAARRGDMDFINYLNSWIETRTVNKWLERRRNYWFASMDWADRL